MTSFRKDKLSRRLARGIFVVGERRVLLSLSASVLARLNIEFLTCVFFSNASRTILINEDFKNSVSMTKITTNDYLSKAELLSLQKGMEDIKNGRTYKMQEGESLTDFLKRTEPCMR